MKQSIYPQLQLESTWILVNIASGTTTQCESIIAKGGLKVFVRLLSDNKLGVVEQAIWGIGNIAGDCSKFRDLLI